MTSRGDDFDPHRKVRRRPPARPILVWTRCQRRTAIDYEDFRREFDRARAEWYLGRGDVTAALAGLAQMVAAINDAGRRPAAQYLVDQWAAEASPAAVARMAEVSAISTGLTGSVRENATDPTGAEVVRLWGGIARISTIADQAATASERRALLALNEPLLRLIEEFGPGPQGGRR